MCADRRERKKTAKNGRSDIEKQVCFGYINVLVFNGNCVGVDADVRLCMVFSRSGWCGDDGSFISEGSGQKSAMCGKSES